MPASKKAVELLRLRSIEIQSVLFGTVVVLKGLSELHDEEGKQA